MRYTKRRSNSSHIVSHTTRGTPKYRKLIVENKRKGLVLTDMINVNPQDSLKKSIKELKLIRQGKIKPQTWAELKSKLEGK